MNRGENCQLLTASAAVQHLGGISVFYSQHTLFKRVPISIGYHHNKRRTLREGAQICLPTFIHLASDNKICENTYKYLFLQSAESSCNVENKLAKSFGFCGFPLTL